MTLNIASIQMVSTPDLNENLDTAGRLVKEAAHAGAQVIALPEYFCMMGMKDTDKVQVRELYGSGPYKKGSQALRKIIRFTSLQAPFP